MKVTGRVGGECIPECGYNLGVEGEAGGARMFTRWPGLLGWDLETVAWGGILRRLHRRVSMRSSAGF